MGGAPAAGTGGSAAGASGGGSAGTAGASGSGGAGTGGTAGTSAGGAGNGGTGGASGSGGAGTGGAAGTSAGGAGNGGTGGASGSGGAGTGGTAGTSAGGAGSGGTGGTAGAAGDGGSSGTAGAGGGAGAAGTGGTEPPITWEKDARGNDKCLSNYSMNCASDVCQRGQTECNASTCTYRDDKAVFVDALPFTLRLPPVDGGSAYCTIECDLNRTTAFAVVAPERPGMALRLRIGSPWKLGAMDTFASCALGTASGCLIVERSTDVFFHVAMDENTTTSVHRNLVIEHVPLGTTCPP